MLPSTMTTTTFEKERVCQHVKYIPKTRLTHYNFAHVAFQALALLHRTGEDPH